MHRKDVACTSCINRGEAGNQTTMVHYFIGQQSTSTWIKLECYFFRDRALARFSLRVNAQTNSNEKLKLATSSKKRW